MATATQNQVSEFAYQAGLRGQESMTCPRSYRGWVIPEMFEDGAMAFGIWRHFYAEGLEQAAQIEHSRWEAAADGDAGYYFLARIKSS